VAAVRSALLEIPGVTRAQVTLERAEAIVTYDPQQVKVESLVAAVDKAEGPFGAAQYHAEVKGTARPASTQ
jgi:copper chaperone CopZ